MITPDPKRLEWLKANFPEAETADRSLEVLISAPGRTEVGGNHTDHQRGNVLAAAINLDILLLAAPVDSSRVQLQTDEFGIQDLKLDSLLPFEGDSPSSALIRGVAAYLDMKGFKIGGFAGSSTSEVLIGSGLSSSAAFENAVGQTFNYLYNGGEIPLTQIALAGQYAENNYLGKMSGLMDQTASAQGGFTQIDFRDPTSPKLDPIKLDPATFGYSLCITNTRGSHANLDSAYSAMPAEMKAVATFFGKTVLSEVSEEELLANVKAVREATSDRAVLRAFHFFADNKRAVLEAEALKHGDFNRFLELVRESGQSSLGYLQNIWNTPEEQAVTLALCLSEQVLAPVGEAPQGAWRVHGGGFAGTIQAFVPDSKLEDYKTALDSLFGEGSCQVLQIRPEGAVKL